jgi:hypothetical protein
MHSRRHSWQNLLTVFGGMRQPLLRRRRMH